MTCRFLLEAADGQPADPPSFTTVAPLWRVGDTIPLGPRTLRVVDVRETDADEPTVLVVEEVAFMRASRSTGEPASRSPRRRTHTGAA